MYRHISHRHIPVILPVFLNSVPWLSKRVRLVDTPSTPHQKRSREVKVQGKNRVILILCTQIPIGSFRPASSTGEVSQNHLIRLNMNPLYDSFYHSPKIPMLPLKALIEDLKKTAGRQAYHVVMKGGNKKDKNGDLRKVKLGCTKGGLYKEKRGGSWTRRTTKKETTYGLPFQGLASQK